MTALPRSLFLTSLLVLLAAPTVAHAEEPEAPASSTSSSRKGFVVGGVALSLASYGAAAWVGTWDCQAGSVCSAHKNELFVPVAGPLLYATHLARTPLPEATDLPADVFLGPRVTRWLGVSMFVADSALQVGGLALAIYGLAGTKSGSAGPTPAAQGKITLHPVVSPKSLGLRGEF